MHGLGGEDKGTRLTEANHETVELFPGRELEVDGKQLLIRGCRCEASDRDRLGLGLGAQAEKLVRLATDVLLSLVVLWLLTLFSFGATRLNYLYEGLCRTVVCWCTMTQDLLRVVSVPSINRLVKACDLRKMTCLIDKGIRHDGRGVKKSVFSSPPWVSVCSSALTVNNESC